MGRRVAGTLDGHLTVREAMTIRADQAKLADHCADRAEQARAVAQYGAMRHWTSEYRRATTQCRVLGERSRRLSAARHDATVTHVTPRPDPGVRSAGEAA